MWDPEEILGHQTLRQTILSSCQPGNLTAFHNYISLIYVTPKEILWLWCQRIWEHRECVCGLSRRDWQDDLCWNRILRGQCRRPLSSESLIGRCVPSKTRDGPFLECVLGAICSMHLEPVLMFVCVCQSLSVDFSFLVNFS